MESRRFSDVLRAAVSGDPDAVEAILDRYMPLISGHCVVNGRLDKDLRQYVIIRVITQIPKFDLDREK